MFKELSPLLRQRAVLLTVTRLEEDEIGVNIVPKKLKESENNALTTALEGDGDRRGIGSRAALGDREFRLLSSANEELA